MTSPVDLHALAGEAVPAGVVDRLRAARRVLAVGHENPDADTLGATLGVCAVVRALGGRADPVASDPVPPLYRFIPGMSGFASDPDPDADYDLLVLSDCAADERVGEVAGRHPELFARLPRIVIDHHASNDADGDGRWVDAASAATCELVTLLAARVGIPLDVDDGALATALLAGIVMDTATFAHPNTTPRTLAVAAALLEAGAPLSDISRRLYRTKPEQQLRLFGRVLDRLEGTLDGRVVWSTLTLDDLAETGSLVAHSEGIIDLLAQSEAAEVAMLLKEQDDGTTRLSVRTRPGGVDATTLTGAFGGGGHARAAGASVVAPLPEATERALEVAERLAAAVSR